MAKYQKYAEYKDSGVEWLGDIPSHWESKKLKFLLNDLVRGPFGSALKKDFFVNSGYKVYEQKNCIRNDVTIGDSYVPIKIYDELERFRVKAHDLLMSCSGTIGKVVQVPKIYEAGIINQALLVMRLNFDLLDSNFFLYSFRSEDIQNQIKDNTQGGAMQNLVATEIFKSISFPIPKFTEQVQIANFLDHETAQIDTLIAKQEKLIELLKEKRQAVISHAVTKGLNPNVPMKDSGVEWLGEVPEHWSVLPIKYLTKYVGTGGTPKNQNSFSEIPEVNWFTPGDFSGDLKIVNSSKYVTFSSVKDGDSKLHERNSVLMIGIGATLGKVAISEVDFSCNQQINILTCNKLIIPEFLTFSLMSQLEQIKQLSNSSTIGIINQEKTKQISISVPTVEEQNKIIDFINGNIERFNILINKAESAIELMQERRTALISAAVTGKIDVRDWQNLNKNKEADMELSA